MTPLDFSAGIAETLRVGRLKIVFVRLLLVLSACAGVHATCHALELQFEPRVSWQKMRLFLPTRDEANRLLYGARLSLGVPVFALETEYLYHLGTREETVNGVAEAYSDLTQEVRGGIRLVPRVLGPVRWEFRGGVGGRFRRIGSVIHGTEVMTDVDPTIYSYLGTGLCLEVGARLRVHMSVTGVIQSWTTPDADFQVQTGIAWAVW